MGRASVYRALEGRIDPAASLIYAGCLPKLLASQWTGRGVCHSHEEA